jgi:hypothetical protein
VEQALISGLVELAEGPALAAGGVELALASGLVELVEGLALAAGGVELAQAEGVEQAEGLVGWHLAHPRTSGGLSPHPAEAELVV